ncbi:hypothetical protein F5B18DRAFT_231556 [Nemania serpens]|nr:hypothetical protein F5B18DRAFT_231556 [Nemania serpens]
MGEEAQGLLGVVEKPTTLDYRSRNLYRALLIVSGLLNILFLLLGIISWTHHPPSYENGFTLDLEAIEAPVKAEIEVIEKVYGGGVNLNSEGEFVADEEGHEYIGPPSKKVDDAWNRLLEGTNIDVSPDEADLSASTFRWPESGLYFTGLEVYHSLHCLNRLRQALYPDHYDHVFDSPSHPSRLDHISHCVNHIRQALQCHADLTPMEWRLDGSKVIVKTNTRHTCRNWDKINDWATARRTKFESIESWKNGSLVVVD